jgi:Protein of unknwon function (DUF3310)
MATKCVYTGDGNPTSPHHYTRYKTQPVDFLTESLGPGFLVANVVKYVLRYDKKNGIEDVMKARTYCDFLINHLEGRKPSDTPTR